MNFDLEKIIQSLSSQKLEFGVLGGVAVSAYSSRGSDEFDHNGFIRC